jgi:two-component system cell cycle sensor histidine kinase/response regulator CckA
MDLNDVVEHLAEPLGRMIGEDIQLRIDSAADLGSVHADPGQVEQTLMNLVVNARDAMPAGGELTIRTANVQLEPDLVPPSAEAPSGPHVLLAVRDTGLGMDAATRERIFEPFFTTKPVGQGTGLGLAMVYAFVRESGGHVHVTSEEARGTTFSIYLPRVSTPAEDQTGRAGAKRDCRGDETILVAEDDSSVRQLVVRVLRQYGYAVLESTSAKDALAIGQQPDRAIHLLVTDVVMPGMNGRELAEHLQAARPDLPVLYISGYAESALGNRPQERPDPFLRKPFPPETLVREVRRVLDAAAVP